MKRNKLAFKDMLWKNKNELYFVKYSLTYILSLCIKKCLIVKNLLHINKVLQNSWLIKTSIMLFASLIFVFNNVISKENSIIAKFENTTVLSKHKEACRYSKIIKKYQVVIFAKIEDCSSCISKNSPWIKLVNHSRTPACFVVCNKSFRVAKYYFESNQFPFDFYCDTTEYVMKLIGDKSTPVVLISDTNGKQIFFDNPLQNIKEFMRIIDSIKPITTKK